MGDPTGRDHNGQAPWSGEWDPPAVDPRKPHYILWNPGSILPPTVRFSTVKNASDAAEVMANRYPGQTFHICKVVGHSLAPVEAVETEIYRGGK